MSIKYREGYKYQLAEDYTVSTGIFPAAEVETQFIKMRLNGELTIKAGYAWDGASSVAIDTPAFMRGSLVHDALYQLIGDGSLSMQKRKAADSLLAHLCGEDGMSSVRAWYVHQAVKAFGGTFAKAQKEVMTAP
jgi:hypothetical protein